MTARGGFGWLGAVAGVPAVLFVGFVATAGWLSPHRLTQQTLIATLARGDGVHPGFRRNHAKGVCVTGSFIGNGAGAGISRASVLAKGTVPVVGRFSLAGGMPYQPDAPDKVRSLALSIATGGQTWRVAMIDLPVFPAATPAAFNGLLLATAPDPVSHKPDGAKVAAFLAHEPDTAAALALVKAHDPTAGFADDRYNSLDSFLFTNARGDVTPVRWSFQPEQPAASSAGAGENAEGRDYLFDDLTTALHKGPLKWRLVITAAAPGDPIANPTKLWPADRASVDVGELVLSAAESEDVGPCTGLVFDPTILPDGMGLSDDPMPSARSAVYMRSKWLRSEAPKPPSAISQAAVEVAGGAEGRQQ